MSPYRESAKETEKTIHLIVYFDGQNKELLLLETEVEKLLAWYKDDAASELCTITNVGGVETFLFVRKYISAMYTRAYETRSTKYNYLWHGPAAEEP